MNSFEGASTPGGGAEQAAPAADASAGPYAELAQLQRFLENIINAIPLRLLVLGPDLRVIHANPAYYIPRNLSRSDVVGREIGEVFPPSLLEGAGLREALLATLRTGERIRWSGYRQASPDHGERIVNIRLDPCEGRYGERNVLLTIEDVTDRHRQLYERTILQQISRAMLGQLELPRLLHAILTGMTAGGAVGLGFNRAVMLLVDEEQGELRAEMAVGPESPEQAVRIWKQIADEYRTLDDLLAAYEKLPPPEQRPLHDLVESLVFPLDETETLPMSALAHGRTVHVVDARSDPQVSPELYQILGATEFVVAPMVAKGRYIGAAIADNFVTRQPIGRADVELLTALANQAALSIDSARMHREVRQRADELDEAYRKLQQAQQQNITTAKLATLGQIAAVVAHEIRNPLATVGGFARSIARNPDASSRNRRNAEIIFDEVQRLEGILADLLNFTRPRPPMLVPADLRPLVLSTLELLDQQLREAQVSAHVDLGPDPLVVSLDEQLFKQVLINLIKNAVEAMADGGTLTIVGGRNDGRVELHISDTGPGIPEERLGDLFQHFVTTKENGAGLGLALSRQIVADHGAELTVSSAVGGGTTFTVRFPDVSNAAEAPPVV